MGMNRQFPLLMTSTESCDRPDEALQLYFRLPSSQIDTHHVLWAALAQKTEAPERAAAFAKYHRQPSTLS